MKFVGLLVFMSVGFSLLIWVSVVLTGKTSDGLWTFLRKSGSNVVGKGNLLPIGLDEKSCLSMLESDQYRRGMPREASPYLLSKLRSYEARHRTCGVHTESYNKTVQLLQSGGTYNSTTDDTADCRYIVWVSFEGLGNKMLTLASAFLYALLTDRVVLADRGVDIPDLFCEPFPQVSWFLPLDFPLTDQFNFNQESNRSYSNLLLKSNSSSLPYAFLYLVHDYDGLNRHFFCDEDQAYLHNIPWLIMKSDVYTLPAFFLIPSFQQELDSLFPDKESVFHLLGRYLLHPTNSVWELITNYYGAYLSKADEIIGIQIRVFSPNGPFTYDQILSCTTKGNVLPQVNSTTTTAASTTNTTKVAILMASLSSTYFERLRGLYLENPTVGVFQPSHEGYQQTSNHDHNRKALAEIYLLSFTDKLVTSGTSTFGYVAQSLGGVNAWILYRPGNDELPDPPCRKTASIEPCFHNPPYYDCKYRRNADTSSGLPHVKHCEDTDWGIKLF